MAQQPYRLKLPSPDARVARSVFEEGRTILVAAPAVVLVPIVQWGKIRLRGRISAQAGTIGVHYARPARDVLPTTTGDNAFVYTVDVPTINGTAWVAGTEFSLEIPDTEHFGENWLRLTLTAGVDGAVVDFFDVSGELLGLYH